MESQDEGNKEGEGMMGSQNVGEEQNKEKNNLTVRCSPGSLFEIGSLLPAEAKDRVKQIGFKNMLRRSSIRLPVKSTIEWLMDRAEVTEDGMIVLHIMEGLQLTLKPEDVYLILGVGMLRGKSKELPKGNDQSSNVHEQLYNLLKYASDKWDTKKNKKYQGDAQDVRSQDKDAGAVPGQNMDAGAVPGQPTKKREKNKKRDYFTTGCIRTLLTHRNDEKIKEALDDEMAARLFCIEVLDKLLVSSASSTVPSTVIDAVTDLDKLKDVDWCTVVYEKLKTSINNWKEASKSAPKTRTATGCVYLLLILFLDFIKDENLDRNPLEIPRICQYSYGMIKQVLGDREYDKFDFKCLEDTCYVNREMILAQESEKEMDLTDEDGRPYIIEGAELQYEMDHDGDQLQHDQFPLRAGEDRDVLRLYQEHVVERTRDTIKLNILGHEVLESVYVECFKPRGYMHSSIMYLQCELWNREWKDKVILSQKAVYELLDPKLGTSTLAMELGPQNPKQANLIFIPIVHLKHWFLIVVSRIKSTIYILDSLPSESRVSVISSIISTLKKQLQQSTAGSDYSAEVLRVQPQENTYDCGFHVLLYIKGFDDTEQICGINKDMVKKCRIETSIDLLCHCLNKRDTVITEYNDGDVECLENSFSYNNAVFNTALHEEREEDALFGMSDNPLSVSALMEGIVGNKEAQDIKTPGDDHKQEDTQTRGMERAAGSSSVNVLDDYKKAACGENAEARGNKLKDAGKEERTSQKADIYCNRRKRQKPVSSEMVPSACARQRPLPNLSTKARVWLKDEILEEVYKLVIECKEQVILRFGEISMTGSQLEQSLQGGEGARDLMILLIQCLKKDLTGSTRTFVPPLDKDDQDLEKKIEHALPIRPNRQTRSTKLSPRIIYCPVFFCGEWIVVCFVLTDVNQIHVFCHIDSFRSIRSFCLSLRDKLNEALKKCGYKEVQFPETSLAHTPSSIKPNASVFASMIFLEKFKSSEEKIFKKFTWDDEWKDAFIRAYKLGLLPYFMKHKENAAAVPGEIVQLIKKGLNPAMNL